MQTNADSDRLDDLSWLEIKRVANRL